MTDYTPSPAPPCGYKFTTGMRCLANRDHDIHHGKWPASRPEPNHDYEPWDRRSGRDRRVAEELQPGLVKAVLAAENLVGVIERGEPEKAVLRAASKVNQAIAALDCPVDDEGLIDRAALSETP